MIFVNPHPHPIRFEVDAQMFDVAPNGGECDIPDRKAFVVESRGLPLVTKAAWMDIRPSTSLPDPLKLTPSKQEKPIRGGTKQPPPETVSSPAADKSTPE